MRADHERRHPVCRAVAREGVHRSTQCHKDEGRTAYEQLKNCQHCRIITAGYTIFCKPTNGFGHCQIKDCSKNDTRDPHHKKGDPPAKKLIEPASKKETKKNADTDSG